MIAIHPETICGSVEMRVKGKIRYKNNGGFKMPKLDTVAPGGKGCPKSGREAKKRLIASSVLNSMVWGKMSRKTAARSVMNRKSIPISIDFYHRMYK